MLPALRDVLVTAHLKLKCILAHLITERPEGWLNHRGQSHSNELFSLQQTTVSLILSFGAVQQLPSPSKISSCGRKDSQRALRVCFAVACMPSLWPGVGAAASLWPRGSTLGSIKEE